MIKINKLGKCIIFILIFLAFSSEVYSIGISPARKNFNFQPGLDELVELEVLNTEGKATDVAIYAEGDLEQYVFLSNSIINFNDGETSKKISYRFKLPEKLDKPGGHATKIVIRELQKESAFEGVQIKANVAVVSQLNINVPYPGKYATTELKVAETDSNERINFIAIANNFGTQKIVNAKAILDILGPTNEKITTIESLQFSMDSGSREEIPLVWEGQINSGKYLGKLTLLYDGETTQHERVFNIGSQELEIVDIYVNDFRLGDIAKFNILVESNWAEDFNNVYADVKITDENGQEITTVKSASENILALSKQELTAFWDTAGVQEGSYDMNIKLNYEGKTSEIDVKAFVSLTSIEFDLFGGTGRVVSGGGSAAPVYIIALIVLIGLNIFWFVYFRKRNK